MPFSTRRTLAAAAAAAAVTGSIGLILAASSCDAPRPVVPASHVIVVPDVEHVTGTIDASRIDWLYHFLDTEPGTSGR